MRQFSAADLMRKIGDVTHAASKAPVTITYHRQPRFVMMSIEAFERLNGPAKDPRRVIRTDDPPDDIVEYLLPQLEAFASKGDHDD